MDIPEITPQRFDVSEKEGLYSHLVEHGYAVVKEAARPHELEKARELFWSWLEATHTTKDGSQSFGWDRNDPTTWTDASLNEGHALGDGHTMGICGAATHCPAFWYLRTLPGICGGFAAAYGTDDLVTAFDRMSIQRPSSCGSPSVLATPRGVEAFDARQLHTHFDQDGFGNDELICYGITSLWDMNKRTGATVIVPKSHTPEAVAHIQAYRKEAGIDWEGMDEKQQRTFTEHFTSIGLQPGILNATAGDLCFFDTALYHGVCHGADPQANGPNQLLRTIFIQSMVPSVLLGRGHGENEPPLGSSHRSDVLRARRVAYEKGIVTGGSIINPRDARRILKGYVKNPNENYADPTVRRDWESTPEEVRRLVQPEEPIDPMPVAAAFFSLFIVALATVCMDQAVGKPFTTKH